MYVSSKRTTLGKEFGTSEVQLGTCWAKPCEIMTHVENPKGDSKFVEANGPKNQIGEHHF